jgi:DNA-binding NarL/FixJ family response regulator
VGPLNQASPVRIGLADHHTLCRQGIRRLLDAERGLLVVGEANNGLGALRLIKQLEPDVLLLEWPIPRATASDVLPAIGAACRSTRVIILTHHIERPDIQMWLELGARGVVLKASSCLVLVRAIRAVVRGEYWIGRENVADLVHGLRTASAAGSTSRSGSRQVELTARESEIVHAVAAASANKDIAQRFSISEKTVKHHLTNIFAKLGVSSRLELAVFALNNRDRLHHLAASRRH